MYELVQSLVSGLLIGSTFAVLSVGFSMTWGITHVLNIAHGAFAVLAAYLGYWATDILGIDPTVALLGIVPLFFLLGLITHRTLVTMTARRAEDLAMSSMVLTFGLAIVMENGMRWAWTSDPRVVKTAYTGQAFFIGRIAFPYAYVVSFALAALTVTALHLFVNRTMLGKAVRAVWQNPTGAALAGINLERVTSIAYGLAIATAGVGGVAMSLIYTFDPSAHMIWLVYIFLVVIFGGVGSVLGSALAGLIIGLVVGVSGVVIPLVWVNLVLFSLLILLLLVRPSGLLRR